MFPPKRVSVAGRFLKRLNLRFPTLVLILGLVTLVDIFIPDFIPFIDEIVLALLTVLFGMWKSRTVNSSNNAKQ
jgi:hypothetical protein